MRDRVRAGDMPPPSAPPLSAGEREALVRSLDLLLAAAPRAPRVRLRRLTRLEYRNTLRELLGVDLAVEELLPADGSGGAGFDNNAETLFFSTLALERYAALAVQAMAAAKPEQIGPVCDGEPAPEVAVAWLREFGARALRRPLEAGEAETWFESSRALTQAGLEPDEAWRRTLAALLSTSDFLYRGGRGGCDQGRAGAFPLAERLSYFLWAGPPDAELAAAAASGRLQEPAGLRAQVDRMRQDPRALALGESFAAQWLEFERLRTTCEPDGGRFPTYTPALSAAMFGEAAQFFAALAREDRSALELLDADWTYLNEELARHYGIEGVAGAELRPVTLVDRRRGGVLGMAAVLTATSYPLRTSPVLRGKWVLDALLGAPPPPPPLDAGRLPADSKHKDDLSLRARLEAHRARPECAACHEKMDPLGFALENFDPIGRWRDADADHPIDAAARLPTGEAIDGPVELKRLLRQRAGAFAGRLAEKLFCYALGRDLDPADAPALERIVAEFAAADYRMGELLAAIAASEPFRRADGPAWEDY